MVRKVNINGKEYPMSFNMPEAEQYCEEQGIDFGDLTKMFSGKARGIIHMAHMAIQFGSKRMGVKFDLSLEELADEIGFEIQPITDAVLVFFAPSEQKKRTQTKRKPRKPPPKKA